MSSININRELIQEWVAKGLTLQAVEQKLSSLGYDESTKNDYLNEFKKTKHAKRQFTGLIYLGVGAFLGFASCVLTITNPIPELYNWILFGLTSVSILIACYGLYNVFE